MSRQKKSRKAPSLGPTQKPRQKKQDKTDTNSSRNKKHKGLASGSRNNPEISTASAKQPNKSNDPRHGSKKPISLTPVEPVKQTNLEPIAQVRKVEQAQLPPEQELEQIENDQRLMALLERVDNDELLTGKDAKYFNAQMARHKALMDELGYEDDEDDYDDIDDDTAADSPSLVEQWENDDGPDSANETKGQ